MRFRLSVLMVLLLPALPLAAAQPIWLTVGEPAWEALQSIDATTRAEATQPVLLRRDAAGDAVTETVRVVAVSPAERDALRRALTLAGRHGGFTAHDTRAAALARLAPPQPAFTPTVPAYAIGHVHLVQPWIEHVSAQRIGNDIQQLEAFHNRYYYASYGVDASNWLAAHWQALAVGRADVTVEQVHRGNDAMASVVLTLPGADLEDQVLVLGAHLDSVNWNAGNTATARAPGADDDASGTASITEVLRVLLEEDYRPQRTLQFMAYAGEELGLYGSEYIADSYAADEIDVVGMLQLDMTGYQGSSGDIYIIDDYTDAAQNDFLAQLAASYLPDLVVGRTTCGYDCSDHASWSHQGYAASMPFEARMYEDNPTIHSENDTFAFFGSSAEHARKFSRLALAWAVELGGSDRIFGDAFEQPRGSGGIGTP